MAKSQSEKKSAAPTKNPADVAKPVAPSFLTRFTQMLDQRPYFPAIFVLFFAVYFRIGGIPQEYPSMDEQWHLNLSTGRGSFVSLFPENTLSVPPLVTSIKDAPPFWNIWTHLQGVTHPPLYLTCLRLWRDVLGDSEAVAVYFSVLCSLVALGFCFAAARLTFGTFTATLGGLLMAASPVQTYFGMQIRGYAMLVALSCILIYLAIRIEKFGFTNRRILVFFFLLLVLMLTHYFSVAICAASGLYLLATCPRPFRWRLVAGFAGVALVYLIIWGPFLREQSREIGPMADSWLLAPGQLPSRCFARFADIPARLFVDFYNIPWQVKIVSACVYAAAFAFSIWHRKYRIWTLFLLATPTMLLAMDLKRSTVHLQLIRYNAASSFAVFVVFAAICTYFRRWIALLLFFPVFLVTVMNGQVIDFRGSPRYDNVNNSIWMLRPNDASTPIVYANGGGPPWQAKGMVLDAANNLNTRGRRVGWIQDVASESLMKQLTGQEFWTAGFPLVEFPEKAFPGSKRIEMYIIPGSYYLARLKGPEGPTTSPATLPTPATNEVR